MIGEELPNGFLSTRNGALVLSCLQSLDVVVVSEYRGVTTAVNLVATTTQGLKRVIQSFDTEAAARDGMMELISEINRGAARVRGYSGDPSSSLS